VVADVIKKTFFTFKKFLISFLKFSKNLPLVKIPLSKILEKSFLISLKEM
jgi:hypothetical protein